MSVHSDIKFEWLGVQSASGTISAPALFVVFAELFASRRKNQATSSNHRTVSSQWSFWTVAFPPRSSLLCVPHHPTAITAMAAMAALTAMGQCMPMNCSRQCKINQSSEFQCLFCELPPACAKGSNGFLNPPQSPLSLQVPATNLQSARPSAVFSQACPRPCIIYSQRGERKRKKKKKTATTTRLSPIEGHNNAYYKIANIFEDLWKPHTVALSILIILNLPFSKRSKETAANIRNPLTQSNIEQHGLAAFDCRHRVQNTQPGHHMLTPTNPRMERSLSVALCGALFWCTGFGHIQTDFKMFPEPTQG